jgi:membrane protein
LGKTGVASAYGAASSLAVILLWVYYSAMILFFGAEYTYISTKMANPHVGTAIDDAPGTETERLVS